MDLFALPFMQRALLAALFTGLAAPAVGTYLVQRRLALMGDGLGHVAVTGVALGLLTGTSPTWTAVVVAVLGEAPQDEVNALAALGRHGARGVAILLRTTEWSAGLPERRAAELDEQRTRNAEVLRAGGWSVAEAGAADPVEEQVVSIFAGVRGYLDKVEVVNVNRFEASLLAELRAQGGDILASIRDKRELTAETEEKLKTFVENFAKTFV